MPAQIVIGLDYGIDNRVTLQYVISMMFAGLAVGEWVAGPLSDSFGRRVIVHSGIGIFILGTLIVLFSGSFTALLIGRIVQGIGMAGVKITSRAIIRDQYHGDEMARITSAMATLFIFIPMIAPMIGEFMINQFGWHSVAWLWFAGAVFLLMWFTTRQIETLEVGKRRVFHIIPIFKAAVDVMKSPKNSGIIIVLGLLWASQLLYLSNAKSIFFDIYSLKGNIGIYFGLAASGVGISAFLNSHLVTKLGALTIAPFALSVFVLIVFFELVVLVILGVVPFTVFLVAIWAKFFCFGMMFGNLNAIGMINLGNIAGLGATLMSAISSLIGVCVSNLIGLFYEKNLLPIVIGWFILACCAWLVLKWSLKYQAAEIQ